MRSLFLAVCALALLVAAGCGSDESEEPDASAEGSGLKDLAGVDAYARAFDAGKGAPRLVLLLSPT